MCWCSSRIVRASRDVEPAGGSVRVPGSTMAEIEPHAIEATLANMQRPKKSIAMPGPCANVHARSTGRYSGMGTSTNEGRNNATANGGILDFYECNDQTNQQWTFTNGQIISAMGNYCLGDSVAGSGTGRAGDPLVLQADRLAQRVAHKITVEGGLSGVEQIETGVDRVRFGYPLAPVRQQCRAVHEHGPGVREPAP